MPLLHQVGKVRRGAGASHQEPGPVLPREGPGGLVQVPNLLDGLRIHPPTIEQPPPHGNPSQPVPRQYPLDQGKTAADVADVGRLVQPNDVPRLVGDG